MYPNLIKQQKDGIRETYGARRRAIAADEKAKRDAKICSSASSLVSFRHADYVLLYAATDDEISVDSLAEAALAAGKKVAFPRCDKEHHTMTYHVVSSLDELSPGAYGIREPAADAPVYDPASTLGSAVCFVPGLVYDKAGYRLGYGKGFYDRYLAAFAGCTIGIVYSDFILPAVPRGRYDVAVNTLLTEKGVRSCEA